MKIRIVLRKFIQSIKYTSSKNDYLCCLLNMKRLLLILLSYFVIAQGNIEAQSTTIGSGTFTSNIYGPMYTTTGSFTVSRYAYIYSAGDLGMLQHGDSISSVSFFKDNNDTLKGNNNLKIYIRPTNQKDFGAGILRWSTELSGSGFVKVFDGNPNTIINVNRGFVTFDFISPYPWDTSFGQNLELLIEYSQPDNQLAAINWRYDNSNTQISYLSNQSKFNFASGVFAQSDSLTSSNERKPMLRINFPRYNIEIGALALYSFGKIPVPLGNPDTVKVLLLNSGKYDVVNRHAYLHSVGANNFIDTLTFSLKKNHQQLFSFPIRNLNNIGMDTLLVVIEPDGIASNDTVDGLREATAFTYSYRNLKEPPAPGGIGFNGGTGDFVAKFISSQNKAINQISVMFGFGNQPFRIGIWDASGPNGKPGTLLWQSDSQTSKAGEFIMPVWPPISVNGTFFVGVRQIGLNNIAFGYQNEDPVRIGTFFETSPTGSSNWNDFSPDAPFRFMIEPRIQADNDVTPISILTPKDTLISGNFDTIAPQAIIKNIGTNNQTDSFAIQCNIKYYGGQLIYTSTVYDTLSSGNSRMITFEKSFFPTFSGEYTIEVFTNLRTDQFQQNDTITSSVLAGKFSDVGMTLVFIPFNGETYQYNIDTIMPTVKADNFGFDNRTFLIVGKIIDEQNNAVWSDSVTKSVLGGQSVTIGFKDYIPEKTGTYKIVAYTDMAGDLDRKNDTIVRIFYVAKDNDVAANYALEPTQAKHYPPNIDSIRPKINVKNYGGLHQFTPFPVVCLIYKNSNLVYNDTAKIQVFIDDSTTVTFSQAFTYPDDGNYKAYFITLLETDQYRKNDTLIIDFTVGNENDVRVVSIINPTYDSVLNLSNLYRPIVVIANDGFKNQFTPFPIYFQSIDSLGKIVQTLVKTVSLSAKSIDTLRFDSTFNARPEGIVAVRAFTSLSTDENTLNDTAYSQYIVSKTYDFEVAGMIKNNNEEEVEVNRGFYSPTLIVQNNSRIITDSAFVSIIIKTPENNIIYNYIKKSNPALFGGRDTIVFPAYFPALVGTYTVHAYIFQIEDQNPFNDTLEFTFESIVNNDLELFEITIPKHNDTFILGKNIPAFVSIKVLNNGRQQPIHATLEVRLLDANDNVIRTDSQAIADTLRFATSQTLIFNNFFNDISTLDSSLHKMEAVIHYDDDQLLDNNQKTTHFYVVENTSVAAYSLGNGITIYPNPFHEFIDIENKSGGSHSIQLLSSDGKIVFESIMEHLETRKRISTNGLAAGVYYLKLNNGKHIFAAKFVKY